MRTILNRWGLLGLAVGSLATVVTGGCGDGGGDGGGAGGPQIVVTTTILGDIVHEITAGTGAEVEVLMPLGADPHEFSASTRQAEAVTGADLLIVNGAGFEDGLEEILERAGDAGTPTFAVADHVDLLSFGDAHAGESGAGSGDRDDPHIWTDPTRVAEALPALGDALAEVDGIDATAVEDNVQAYAAELDALDREIEAAVAAIPEDERVLVTNHEVFGYFADRYGFEVVGTVIPAGTTLAEPSSGALEDLAAVIEDEGVPAIFGETTQSTRLAEALAASVGDEIEIVELYSESLGGPGTGAETYVDLMRTDAQLIVDALSAQAPSP